MTRNELTRRFPNASPAFIKANCFDTARLPAGDTQRDQRKPLVRSISGEETSRVRVKIRFRIFAVRPADWDGWHIKELQDLLIHAGILDGDEWYRVSGEIISEKVSTKTEERTEITVEQI